MCAVWERRCCPYPESGLGIRKISKFNVQMCAFSAFWPYEDKPFSSCSIKVCGWLNTSPIFSRLWTKVYEIMGTCRGYLFKSFTMPLSDCLCHVSLRRYSLLRVISRGKRLKVDSLGPRFLGGRGPSKFYGNL